MHRRVAPLVASLLALLLLVPTARCADEKMKIGVSTALTGNSATYGIDLRNVVSFANQKLAQNRYELIVDDDKCSAREAVTTSMRFINVLQLKYVVGFPCSGSVLAAAPLFERSGTVLISMGGSAPEISHAGAHIFRTWPSDLRSSKKLYEYIASRHQHLGILSEQADYTEAFAQAFRSWNTQSALRITEEPFLTNTPDFRTPLLRLRRAGIDSLFILTQSEPSFLNALKQVRELGWGVQIFSVNAAGTPTVLKNAGQAAEGVVYVDVPSAQDKLLPEGMTLFREFERQYGPMHSGEFMFTAAFEGFRALHQAISSGQDIKHYLSSTTFHGISGDWWFDKNGDIEGIDFIVKVVRSGKGVALE